MRFVFVLKRMPILKPHARTIDDAAAIDGKRTKFTIEGAPGLVLECGPDGGRVWFVRYQIGHGRGGRTRRYQRIGSFDRAAADHLTFGQAKDRSKELIADGKRGIDAFAEARPEAATGATFAGLFDRWLEASKPNRKTWPQDEARWLKLIKPRIGALIVTQIKGRDIATMTDGIKVAATGIQANRCQSLVVTVLGWAFARGELDTMPTHRLPKAVKEKPRDRAMSEDEIRLFWRDVGDAPLGVRMERCLRLALLTGQRRSEIALSAKAEMQLEGRSPQWIIPKERAKNGRAHLVPLSKQAAAIFREAVEASPTDYVFPAQGGAGAIDPHGVTRAMARLGAHLKRDDWPTVHDMRRTVGTQMAMLGVPDAVISAVLNHAKEGITQRTYIVHRYADERRRALRLWQARLRAIVSGRPRALRW
jgi:integrase